MASAAKAPAAERVLLGKVTLAPWNQALYWQFSNNVEAEDNGFFPLGTLVDYLNYDCGGYAGRKPAQRDLTLGESYGPTGALRARPHAKPTGDTHNPGVHRGRAAVPVPAPLGRRQRVRPTAHRRAVGRPGGGKAVEARDTRGLARVPTGVGFVWDRTYRRRCHKPRCGTRSGCKGTSAGRSWHWPHRRTTGDQHRRRR